MTSIYLNNVITYINNFDQNSYFIHYSPDINIIYYKRAIEYIKFIDSNSSFNIISDDNLLHEKLEITNIKYFKINDDYMLSYILSTYSKGGICSNNISFIGGFINKNANKIIIVPSCVNNKIDIDMTPYIICNSCQERKHKIIWQPWGGLGDNLQFSTLPELYDKLGYDVYISIHNKYRNDEINKLVWNNPYIKGYSDEIPNAGKCDIKNIYSKKFIQNIEITHNLRSNNLYPIIYYKPNKIDKYKNDIIIDISSITTKYDINYVMNGINTIKQLHNNKKIYKLKSKYITDIYYKDLELNYEIIDIENIYHYCDIIASCYGFVCLYSGSSVLASTIKRDEELPNIYCIYYFNGISLENNDLYIFPNITYLS